MALLVTDCPHCGTKHVGFSIKFSNQWPKDVHRYNVFGSCPGCHKPFCAVVATTHAGDDPKGTEGDVGSLQRFSVRSFFPVRPPSKSPEHVPPIAAKAFIEGADNLLDGRYTSAVAMFRRSLDVATQQYSDEVTAWKLEKRIDKFAAEGLITKDLKEWAHKIRLDGNEAVHGLDEPTKDAAQELQLFTELILTYLFTLPAKVKANLPADQK